MYKVYWAGERKICMNDNYGKKLANVLNRPVLHSVAAFTNTPAAIALNGNEEGTLAVGRCLEWNCFWEG